MAYQPPTCLDQPGLKTGQRPVLHRLRQRQSPHEVAQVVGQNEQPQPHLVGYEFMAGQPGPVQGAFALFYPLLDIPLVMPLYS